MRVSAFLITLAILVLSCHGWDSYRGKSHGRLSKGYSRSSSKSDTCAQDRRDYNCDKSENKKHTMCKYCGVDKACKPKLKARAGLTKAEKDVIVEKHNDLRRRVAKGRESEAS